MQEEAEENWVVVVVVVVLVLGGECGWMTPEEKGGREPMIDDLCTPLLLIGRERERREKKDIYAWCRWR